MSTAFGFIIGAPADLMFNPARPYVGCRLCGRVFQGTPERNKEWRRTHNKLHSEKEHKLLALSGRWATPEAAQRLAPYGIFNLKDLVLDNEVADALRSAPRLPTEGAD
jgi:hypothetical protein